ncbi:hypothetical protein GCM10018954_035550 [Kutzneria kofuensis]
MLRQQQSGTLDPSHAVVIKGFTIGARAQTRTHVHEPHGWRDVSASQATDTRGTKGRTPPQL